MWVHGSNATDIRARQKRLRLVESDEAVSPPKPLSVLMIDENLADVHNVTRLFSVLRTHAAAVVHAPDLGYAQDLLGAQSFDLIFCDFWLGQGSALGLVQSMQDRGQTTPVTLLSSMDSADLELIARRIGASGYMTKADLSVWTLEQVVTSMLGTGERVSATVGAAQVLKSRRLITGSGSSYGRNGRRAMISHRPVQGNGPTQDRNNIVFLPPYENRFVQFDIIATVQSIVDQWADLGAGPDLVTFHAPRMEVVCWADPTSMHDVLRAFGAEGAEALKRGDALYLVPSLVSGHLRLEMVGHNDTITPSQLAPREKAVEAERRRVVAALASAVHGSFTEIAHEDGTWHLVLTVPLNQATQVLFSGPWA